MLSYQGNHGSLPLRVTRHNPTATVHFFDLIHQCTFYLHQSLRHVNYTATALRQVRVRLQVLVEQAAAIEGAQSWR
jgi:hypothetical protein